LSRTAYCDCGALVRLTDDRGADEPAVCPTCGAVLPGPAITDQPRRRADQRYSPDAPADEPDLPLDGFRVRDVTRPQGRMCSGVAVGIATFLCGPLAGIFLMAGNDFSTSRRRRGWAVLVLGLLASMALALVLASLPDEGMGVNLLSYLVVPLLDGLALALVTFLLQGRAYRQHIEQGGQGWNVGGMIGLSILGMVLFLGLALGIGFAYETATADREVVIAPNKKVLYTRQVSDADARQLGKVLQQIGTFSGTSEQGARLDRDADEWVVSFWLDGNPTPLDREHYTEVARQLSAQAFNGQPVRVQWLGDKSQVKATMKSTQP
jgi:hypothetical protein